MGKKRLDGLPKYWARSHGGYFYRPPKRYQHLFPGLWVPLGRTLQEAHKTFSDLPIHSDFEIHFVRDLADSYEQRVIPNYPPGTRDNKLRSMIEIRKSFGHIPVTAIEPSHAYQYFDHHGGKRTARAVIEDFRHMFTKAVEWGLLKRHPLKGQVVLKKNRSRTRYVTDDEIIAFRKLANAKLRAYIDLKLLTGLPKQDLLCIERGDIREDGIYAQRRKTNSRPKVYSWDDEGVLKSVVTAASAAHAGHVGSTRLFHTRRGKPYYLVDDQGRRVEKPTTFDSMWQRLMTKWVDQGGARFTEHDLRAKAASDTNLVHAQLLMDHTTASTTERIYRRAPKVVSIGKSGPKGAS